ncbi:MAG: acetamidase/formamidase family protein [Chloroflexota bacterium]
MGTDRHPVTHQLDSAQVHKVWDNSIEPRLWIDSGDSITVEVRGGGDGAFTPHSTAEDVVQHPFLGHALIGPIGVHGARPGSVLQVDMLALETWTWGYTLIAPGRGLLVADFPTAFFQPWDLADRLDAAMRPGAVIPLAPFFGVLGVAPAEMGQHSTSPPRRVGGNLDVKQLTVGSTLWLPLEVDGGTFSVGDAHAAQGDGEVCVTAIETGMTAVLRLTLRSDMHLSAPQFRTVGPESDPATRGPWHGTVGVGPNLMTGAQGAVRAMIDFLMKENGLSAEQAYVLCSVACDLKISQVVNAPNWTVSALLPLSIFR